MISIMILKNFVVIFITTLEKNELKSTKKERREKKNKPLAFLYFGGFYCRAATITTVTRLSVLLVTARNLTEKI